MPSSVGSFGNFLDDLLERCCQILPTPFQGDFLDRVVSRFLTQAVDQMRLWVSSTRPTSEVVQCLSSCEASHLLDSDIVPACHRLLVIGLAVDILHSYVPSGLNTESTTTSPNGATTRIGGSETSSDETTCQPPSPIPSTSQGVTSHHTTRNLSPKRGKDRTSTPPNMMSKKRSRSESDSPRKKRFKSSENKKRQKDPAEISDPLDSGLDFVTVVDNKITVPSTSKNPLVVVNPPAFIFNKPKERRVLLVSPEPVYFELSEDTTTVPLSPLRIVRSDEPVDSPLSPPEVDRHPTPDRPVHSCASTSDVCFERKKKRVRMKM